MQDMTHHVQPRRAIQWAGDARKSDSAKKPRWTADIRPGGRAGLRSGPFWAECFPRLASCGFVFPFVSCVAYPTSNHERGARSSLGDQGR